MSESDADQARARAQEHEDEREIWARPRNDVLVDGHHLLEKHSNIVAARMVDVLDGCSLEITGDRTAEFCRIIGYCHDFGKCTEWFQDMVHSEGDVNRGDPRTYHSLLGALLSMYVLEIRGFKPKQAALGGIIVMAHHAPMPDPADRADRHRQYPLDSDVQNDLTKTYDRIGNQLASVRDHASELVARMIDQSTNGEGSIDEFEEWLSGPNPGPVQTFHQSQLAAAGGIPPGLYTDVLIVYSALKFADTSHSASVIDDDLFDSRLLDITRLHERLHDLSPDDPDEDNIEDVLNKHRSNAQTAVKERMKLVGPDAPVASIWLPTGFGKTFTGLLAALMIADRHDKERVIYALPFTSIIDQTADVICDERLFNVTPGSPDFIVDHHLADGGQIIQHDPDEIDQPIDSSIEYLLGGSWRAGCVLTTFVQLFESLIAPSGTQAPKVPAIRDSVIILDEPQELPPRLWPLLTRVIELLADQFDAYVIFMTATRPRFFEYYSDLDVVNLIDNPDPFVEFLQRNPRVEYQLHRSAQQYVEASDEGCEAKPPIDYTTAATMICDALDGSSTRSALAVCNTVSSSRELFGAVQNELNDRGRTVISPALVLDHFIQHDDEIPTADTVIEGTLNEVERAATEPVITLNLTARHRPRDRRILIDVLNVLLDKSDVPIIVTSTRLIEAGVDISVDRLYRDIAQVTSIVQSGGRCNRSFDNAGGNGGVVTVWRLGPVDPDTTTRTPANHIYGTGGSGDGGMAQTRAALRGHGDVIDEGTMITTVVEEFFDAMHKYGHGDRRLAQAIDHCDVNTLRSVQLIDDQPWLTDVIVTRTADERDTARDLRDELASPPGKRDQARRKRLLDAVNQIRYGVPVPLNDDGDPIPAVLDDPAIILMGDHDLLWIDSQSAVWDPDQGVRFN